MSQRNPRRFVFQRNFEYVGQGVRRIGRQQQNPVPWILPGSTKGIGRRNGGFSDSALANKKCQPLHPAIVAIVNFENGELPTAKDAVTCPMLPLGHALGVPRDLAVILCCNMSKWN
jgi:hypothetical protein